MVQIFSNVALILAISVAIGSGDPVGISDESVETDPGPREVSIDGARWESLRVMAEFEEPVEKAPGPWAADRQVTIERSNDGVRIRVTWTLETIEAGWWTGPLIGPVTGMRVESVEWRGRDLGVTSTPAGEEVALQMTAKSRGALELVVFVPADQLPGGLDGSINVSLMPAVRGELRLDGATPEGRVAELVIGDGQARRMIDDYFWAGESQLSLNWVDAKSATDQVEGPLAVAQSAVGLTFGDGEVRGRARVSWLLRRGQFDRVTIDTAGLGRDLEVVGPNVHEWARNGDRIDIALKEPVDGRVDVDLRWTQGLPDGAEAQLAAPRIIPQQAYRTETFMQIARDGELEVVPALSGWSAVARAELPEWASGYIEGTATATYRHDSEDPSASFELLRFVPLSGPPMMVDVAAYEIATTDEGRSLVHARYDVRNERASHLRLELPKGSRMLGVRVNGETVTPTREANSATANTQAWRIPLVRSLESVMGSLSFPVEVIFIGEAESWEKKESRELQLPALDAPVAVSRVQVYLPPNYENRVDVGDFHRVNDFSEGEGITYGLGVGASSAELGRADELYRQALSSWMDNDFRRAQSSLDELSQLGASNANIAGLQGNLDLVQGREQGNDGDTGDGQSAVVSRRIKDQAKMRATDDKIALLEKAREADELEAQGQYDQAEQKLAEAQELGDRLALLEQSESKEQVVYNQSLSSTSARVADKKKRKVSRESEAKKLGKKVSVYDVHDATGALMGEPIRDEAAKLPQGAKSIPIGTATSRDFTAVVEAEQAVMPVAPAPDPNAALAGPVTTASAVSIHVPAIGEAVLYQHMLLPEGKALTVHLEARRHKKSKRKSK
jgi:hypothetical protein